MGRHLLGPEHQRELLDLAWAALRTRLCGMPPPASAYPQDHPFQRRAGIFVTLRKKNGDLRGCIGRTVPGDPLWQIVPSMAVAAATTDPRFAPVLAPELDGLRLGLSVLGVLEPCTVDQVEIGLHGLVVEGFSRRGLLLPEVAPEYEWTPEQFLVHTCLKAGLPSDAVENGARLYRFQTQHFGD